MKLSTKGRYGLRALADLALHSGGQPVALMTIAKRQHLSDGYLESMFGALRRAGLVRSVKGAGGGYVLAREASSISVGEVLNVLEGDLSIVDQDERAQQDMSLRGCIKSFVWDEVSQKISGVVDTLTLEDLVSQCRAD
jgi:Rrf2 family protein